MRITNSALYRFGVRNTQEQRARLATLQEQSSTGKRINRPSDDPVRVRATTLIHDGLAHVAQYRRNITTSRLRISTTESALTNSYDVMVRAKEIALQGANGTFNDEGRQNLALSVEQLHDELLREANSRDAGGGRVFSGFATDVDPFAVSGDFVPGAAAPTVSFVGDSSEIEVDIDQGVSLKVTLQGDRIFKGVGGGEDLFAILEDLWTALDTNDQAGAAGVLDRIDTAQAQVSAAVTTIGASDSQAQLWETRHSERNALMREQLSLLEDADSIEVFSDLVQQEGALQGSIEVTSRILQTNLLSFL